MKKYIFAVIVGAMCAVGLFVLLHKNAVRDAEFRLGLYDTSADEESIKKTLAAFNKIYATIYDTGGTTKQLNEFPAANLVKRRIYQEVYNWKDGGKVLAYDKFDVKPESVELIGPDRAVAITQEAWGLLLKKLVGGESISEGQKPLEIKVRYILGRTDAGWKVLEYEVYAPSGEVPELGEAWRL